MTPFAGLRSPSRHPLQGSLMLHISRLMPVTSTRNATRSLVRFGVCACLLSTCRSGARCPKQTIRHFARSGRRPLDSSRQHALDRRILFERRRSLSTCLASSCESGATLRGGRFLVDGLEVLCNRGPIDELGYGISRSSCFISCLDSCHWPSWSGGQERSLPNQSPRCRSR